MESVRAWLYRSVSHVAGRMALMGAIIRVVVFCVCFSVPPFFIFIFVYFFFRSSRSWRQVLLYVYYPDTPETGASYITPISGDRC